MDAGRRAVGVVVRTILVVVRGAVVFAMVEEKRKLVDVANEVPGRDREGLVPEEEEESLVSEVEASDAVLVTLAVVDTLKLLEHLSSVIVMTADLSGPPSKV